MADLTELPQGGSFLWEEAGSRKIMAPELFTDEQREFARTAREFTEKEIHPRLASIEAKDPGVVPDLLRKAGELGLLMVDVPEEYGGIGASKVTSMLVAEQFATIGSFAVSLGAHTGIGTLPIVYYGTPEQKARYLPDLATGNKLAAYALTEANSGSDALAAQARAVLSPDGSYYRLDGSKQFITNAGFADLFTVFAKIDGERFTAFLVERRTRGVSVGPEEHKMGIRGSSTCTLILDDVRVPAENVLGAIGHGHKIAFNTLNIGRLKLGVATLGGSKDALEFATRYALDRKQFGKPIASFGLIREKLADMALRILVNESLGYRTTGMIDEHLAHAENDEDKARAIEEFSVEASILKIYGSEALDFVADEAVQVLGGYGFIEEYPVARILRDSRIFRIFEGTNEINRLIVPGTLFRRAMKGELPLMDVTERVTADAAAGRVPPVGGSQHEIARGIAERAKWTTLFVTRAAIEKYLGTVAEEQEVLGVIADRIQDCFAIDSLVARSAVIREHGSDTAKDFVSAALVAYIPPVWSRVFHTARHLLMDMLDGEALAANLEAVSHLAHDLPCKVMKARRKIADAVVAAGGYPL
ncbi:MAG: acyl-CoA dehydrogenase family protein [Deltaproteobacteria bacterium]|nr:acyl-CoA dehydrogenase family protein [Deltaproteobacteria bacterium]